MKYWLQRIPQFIFSCYDNLQVIKNLFTTKIPINTNNLSCNPLIIVSSGRSGTTLLRVMLTKNSKLSIPPESQFFHKALRKFISYHYLGWEELIKIVIGELESKRIFNYWDINLAPVYYELKNLEKSQRSLAKIIDSVYLQFLKEKNPMAEIWGDKSPIHTYHLNLVHRIFPNAYYIHLIRDGRAAVNSMIERNYLNNSIDKACKRWNNSINDFRKFKAKHGSDKLIEIKYENLVQNPQKELKRICDKINIPFEKQMLDPQKSINKYGDTKLKHHKNLKNPVNTQSIDKWENQLSEKEKKLITTKLRKNLTILGYI